MARSGPKQIERVEVEEDDGHVIDPGSAPTLVDRVIRDVPRRHPSADVLQDAHTVESLRPIVEVLLVAELPVLVTVVAPLDAALAPPVESLGSVLIAAKCQPFDVVNPTRRLIRRPLIRHGCGNQQ